MRDLRDRDGASSGLQSEDRLTKSWSRTRRRRGRRVEDDRRSGAKADSSMVNSDLGEAATVVSDIVSVGEPVLVR